MRQIYCLLRLRGMPPWKAAAMTPLIMVTGLGSYARYTLMTRQLDELDDES